MSNDKGTTSLAQTPGLDPLPLLKWKQINKKRDIKGRLVAQGFQDRQCLSTFAGRTSRWGQRLVLAIATQFSWSSMSADASEVFLRGITFKQS